MKRKIFKSDKIFIAGSNGMVGSAIFRKFKEAGYGDLKSGGNLLVPTRNELNLIDDFSVKKWYERNKPDVVIIAAAKVGGIVANNSMPVNFLLENIKIQNNLIENAWRFGVKRLLFLGSSCIYPKYSNQPITEEELLNGELESTNQWYALAKIAGIKLCEALRIQHNFDAICLMPTNLYGPRDNYHPINSHVFAALIRKFYEASKEKNNFVNCWGTGNVYREFMHVDDLAEAVLFSLENWDPAEKNAPKDKNGSPLIYLNVGTGKDISIKGLANKIRKVSNYDCDITWDTSKPDGTQRKLLSIERIKKLGWSAKISLDFGIKETFEEIKNKPYLLDS